MLDVHHGTSPTTAAAAKAWGQAQVTIDLADGGNPLGITEWGLRHGWDRYRYVDFVRLNVIQGAAPSPAADAVWKLAGPPTELARNDNGSGWFTWKLSGEAGSLTSTITSTEDPKGSFTVHAGWTVPDTLAPDEVLAIQPTLERAGKLPTGYNDTWGTPKLRVAMLATDAMPTHFLGGDETLAELKVDGSIATAPAPPVAPAYVPGQATHLVVQVEFEHRGGTVDYQYVYEWAGPR
jgi:hypothetical protein